MICTLSTRTSPFRNASVRYTWAEFVFYAHSKILLEVISDEKKLEICEQKILTYFKLLIEIDSMLYVDKRSLKYGETIFSCSVLNGKEVNLIYL